jgi:CHAT domain-containing protein
MATGFQEWIVVRALAAAKREIRWEHSESYYWAAFILQGDS